MAKNSFIDTFVLCWDAILMESKAFNSVMFNEQHCLTDESRDTNFDTVENRLAYMYKFGSFNALFVQKCIASFLDNYSDGEKLFSSDNLKICSLSNGPGLELVGLLCGIYENCQKLKSFPVLKTINLYNSWWSICKRIFSSVFQAARAFSKDSFDIPSEIIHFIQSDIYSTLSPDVGECIKDSDILLMVKVFASTKATCDVVMKSMEEIFSLLKPGSFVFFVGSRKNTKELTANYSLSKFVSCILGPIKISVTDLHVHEAVVKSVGIKPKESGYAYFIVWQKKASISPEDIPKKKKNRKRKKKSKVKVQKELIDCTTISKEMTDDINECSDISFSSHSKQSETLSDDFNSTSSENMSISPVEINLQNLEKEEHSLPQKDSLLSLDSITSLLDEIQINSKRENLTEVEDIHESRKGVGCLEGNVQDREFENRVVKDVVVTETKNQGDLLNEISGKQTVDVEMVLTKATNKEAQLVRESDFCKIVNMEPLLTHHQNKELNLKQKYMHPMKDDSTCLLDKSNLTLKSSNEESLLGMQLNSTLSACESPANLKKSMQTKKLEIPVAAQEDIISSPSQVTQKKKKEIIANQGKDHPVLKEDVCDEESTSKSSSRKSSINILYVADMLKTDIQNMNVKKVSNNETMKVPIKNKKQSVINKKTVILPELNIENKKSKNGTRIIFENQSHENCHDFKINMTSKERIPEISDKNKDFNCLLERCESLVSSLEKLTANLKQNITLSYEGDSNCCIRESCAKLIVPHACVNSCCANAIHSNCSRESCAKFKIPHAYVNSCCVNVVHSNCSRKVYNCQMTHNPTYTTCPRHFHAEIKPR